MKLTLVALLLFLMPCLAGGLGGLVLGSAIACVLPDKFQSARLLGCPERSEAPDPQWFEIQMIAEADKQHPEGWVLSCHFIEDGNRVCQLAGRP